MIFPLNPEQTSHVKNTYNMQNRSIELSLLFTENFTKILGIYTVLNQMHIFTSDHHLTIYI